MRGYLWLQLTHHAATYCTLQQIYRRDAKGVNAGLHVGPGDLRAFFSHLFLDVWAFQNILPRIHPWITVRKRVHHTATCATPCSNNICDTLQLLSHTIVPCATHCYMLQHGPHAAACATSCNNNICDTLQQLSHTKALWATNCYTLQHVQHAAPCATLCNNFHIPKQHVGMPTVRRRQATHVNASNHATHVDASNHTTHCNMSHHTKHCKACNNGLLRSKNKDSWILCEKKWFYSGERVLLEIACSWRNARTGPTDLKAWHEDML